MGYSKIEDPKTVQLCDYSYSLVIEKDGCLTHTAYFKFGSCSKNYFFLVTENCTLPAYNDHNYVKKQVNDIILKHTETGDILFSQKRFIKYDKYDPKQGEWVEVSWKDIESFRKGAILNRIWANEDCVMEIIRAPYWKDSTFAGPLLAVDVKKKVRDNFYNDTYYLADLFNGIVKMRRKEE